MAECPSGDKSDAVLAVLSRHLITFAYGDIYLSQGGYVFVVVCLFVR